MSSPRANETETGPDFIRGFALSHVGRFASYASRTRECKKGDGEMEGIGR